MDSRRPASSSSLYSILGHVLGGNFVRLAASAALVLFIPSILGVEDYGYFQLFSFVGNYLSLLHIGLVDGIVLRYAGSRYNSLPFDLLAPQFWMVAALCLAVSASLTLWGSLSPSANLQLLLLAWGIWMPLTVLRGFCQGIAQATLRMRLFSNVLVGEQLFFACGVMVLVLANRASLLAVLTLEVTRALGALAVYVWFCREVVDFRQLARQPLREKVLPETLANIKAGLFIVSAFLVSALVLGVVRIGVGSGWGVEMFGQVSLTLSLSAFIVALLTSVGMTLFPLLKRAGGETLRRTHSALATLLWITLPSSLIGASVLKFALERVLPQYTMAAEYLPILFPVFVFDGVMSLLVTPFLKALRFERALLRVNVLAVAVAIVWVVLSVLVAQSLVVTLLGVPFVSALRCLVASRMVQRRLELSGQLDILLGLTLVCAYAICSLFMDFELGMIVFPLFVVAVVSARGRALVSAWHYVRSGLRRDA